MRIIVGLGNPGREYANTRHNAGFLLVDALAQKLELTWQTGKKLQAEIAKNGEIILVKPLTFMNNSGKAVKAVMLYYKLLPRTLGLLTKHITDLSSVLTVVHDDLDIGLGKYKISVNSRSAGHKGVESIIKYLKTRNFKRIRIGIHANVIEKIPDEKYVLGNFSRPELEKIEKLNDEILDKLP